MRCDAPAGTPICPRRLPSLSLLPCPPKLPRRRVSYPPCPRRLLALSAVCPGASTLVGNLLKSSAVAAAENQQPTLAGRKWLRAYVNGCAHQVGGWE